MQLYQVLLLSNLSSQAVSKYQPLIQTLPLRFWQEHTRHQGITATHATRILVHQVHTLELATLLRLVITTHVLLVLMVITHILSVLQGTIHHTAVQDLTVAIKVIALGITTVITQPALVDFKATKEVQDLLLTHPLVTTQVPETRV